MQRTNLLILVTVFVAACGSSPVVPPQTVQSPSPPAPTATEQPQSVAATPSSRTITLWVAPTFAPNPETRAGALLADQLAAFENAHPGLSIEVRIKSRTGKGSLLETLTAAQIAAPSRLPDLITLDTYALSEAASRGLLASLDDYVAIPAEPEWYPYVLTSMRFDSRTVGMPFASETDILAFRKDLYPTAPRRIETLLAEGHSFQFPAGDPTAQFTLAQYLALEGTLIDPDGKAYIDVESLGAILSFYQAALDANVLPLTVRQWTDASQTWSEIQANRAASAVVPLSLFIQEHDPERLSGAPLPTSTDTEIGLAHTWSWGLVNKNPVPDGIQIELLNHLMNPEFLGSWTHALGLLPPNSAALAAWPDGAGSALVSRLVTVTLPQPSRLTRSKITPAFFDALEAVLTESLTPDAAAQAAADAVKSP